MARILSIAAERRCHTEGASTVPRSVSTPVGSQTSTEEADPDGSRSFRKCHPRENKQERPLLSLQEAPISHLLALLKAPSSKRPELARVAAALRSRQLPRGTKDCTAVLSILARRGLADEAVALWKELQRWGPEPDVILCSAAMRAQAALGLWQEALCVLGEIELGHVSGTLDRPTFGTAATACAEASQWLAALQVLSRLPRVRLEADSICCSAALTSCARAASWAPALLLLRQLSDSLVESDIIAHSTAISACGAGKRWELALLIFSHVMLRSTKVVQGTLQNGQEVALKAVWGAGLEVDAICFNSALSACEAGGQWQQAIELLELRLTKGLAQDAVGLTAAYGACQQGKKWQQAAELWRRDCGSRPDMALFGSALAACERSQRWAQSLNLLVALEQRGLQADTAAFSSAVGACRGAGPGWRLPLNLLDNAQRQGLSLDAAMYTALLGNFQGTSFWRGAVALLADMAEAKLQQDSAVLSAVLDAIESSGCHSCAAPKLLEQLRLLAGETLFSHRITSGRHAPQKLMCLLVVVLPG
ncbi:unnamed protein product [Polarella glacialis]|uniref:Pentatricopeptide repeat-containing protein, chloroplastic n=1 Tax=Polarella glacialis TaxID=89957 RepID=A0A813IQV3_POLGL|nr:unnamed protein product [Polarella glacialis]